MTLTVEEIADRWGIPREMVRGLIWDGALAAHLSFEGLRVPQSELRRFEREHLRFQPFFSED